MIQELSSRVANWMEQEGVISVKDKELFSYAVYSLLFGLLPVFIVVILGLAFGMLREGLLMITPFMLIRKFSGGYHLNSPKMCITFSTVLLALALGIVGCVIESGCIALLTAFVVISTGSLCIFSPSDNERRKLTGKEISLFHRIVCAVTSIFMAVYFIMCGLNVAHYAVPFGVGIILAAMLQLPCILKK